MSQGPQGPPGPRDYDALANQAGRYAKEAKGDIKRSKRLGDKVGEKKARKAFFLLKREERHFRKKSKGGK